MGKKRKTSFVPPKFGTANVHKGFVAIYRDMIDSAAYIALTAHAKEAYTILRSQYKGEAYGNIVKCPYKTFEEHGFRRETLAKAIDNLECYGFVEVDRGGLGHRPSEYTFIDAWKRIVSKDEVKEAEARYKEIQKRKAKAKENKKEWKENHTE